MPYLMFSSNAFAPYILKYINKPFLLNIHIVGYYRASMACYVFSTIT